MCAATVSTPLTPRTLLLREIQSLAGSPEADQKVAEYLAKGGEARQLPESVWGTARSILHAQILTAEGSIGVLRRKAKAVLDDRSQDDAAETAMAALWHKTIYAARAYLAIQGEPFTLSQSVQGTL